jgi:serine/threonine-protein kinase RsbW
MPDTGLPQCEFLADDFSLRFEAEIPATVEAIEPVVGKIMAVVEEFGCADGHEFEVDLALREALSNAILHGCDSDPDQSVCVSVGCAKPKGILITVQDPGEGFDPTSIPSPVIGQNVFSSHGRGIFLINQLMDEVNFDRGGTEIRMVKRGD